MGPSRSSRVNKHRPSRLVIVYQQPEQLIYPACLEPVAVNVWSFNLEGQGIVKFRPTVRVLKLITSDPTYDPMALDTRIVPEERGNDANATIRSTLWAGQILSCST